MTDRFLTHFARPVERLLRLDKINDIFDACTSGNDAGCDASATARARAQGFLNRCLDYLEIRFRLPADDLLRIPKTGPVVVVANHPFGAIDGIILGAVLSSVRPDVKLMANYMLGRIPDLRDLFIFVDPFDGETAAAANIRGMRQSLRHLKDGGCLAAFPAGEVAHLHRGDRRVRELSWNQTIARIARRSGAPVLPIYFDGRNSNAFQALGLIHPRIRTAMLAREVWNKRGRRVDLRVGSLLPHSALNTFDTDDLLAEHLRQRTLVLRHRVEQAEPPKTNGIENFATVIPPVDPALIGKDVDALDACDCFVDADGYQVFIAAVDRLPNVIQEIGRLREITFRATGEGTGKSIDLDEYDRDYLHLFVWHKAKREIVGAYRLGQTDVLLKKFGPAGFYTRTLFDYDDKLLGRIGQGLEMGRSFVRAEYQRGFAPLLMLWKGIATYCVRNPEYKTLFGPVSISNDYQTVSKQLMVRFLKENHLLEGADDLVRPRNPFRGKSLLGGLDESPELLGDERAVGQLVAEVEPDGRGMPVLLRQYLKLGAQLLAFNVDPAFNDAVDGLIIVDLTRTVPKVLERYMGKPGYAEFMSHHK